MSSKFLQVYIIHIAPSKKNLSFFIYSLKKIIDLLMLRVAFIPRSMINVHLGNKRCV